MNFITELELLVSKMKLEKPYVMLFAGDFNAHSKSWYADDDTNHGMLMVTQIVKVFNWMLYSLILAYLHSFLNPPTHEKTVIQRAST